ncbi:MAG: DUF6020 family protein [Lachnospiraceae bacterium]|nr:DUF6020 family protein [Lachnospiraceae bacterium]
MRIQDEGRRGKSPLINIGKTVLTMAAVLNWMAVYFHIELYALIEDGRVYTFLVLLGGFALFRLYGTEYDTGLEIREKILCLAGAVIMPVGAAFGAEESTTVLVNSWKSILLFTVSVTGWYFMWSHFLKKGICWYLKKEDREIQAASRLQKWCSYVLDRHPILVPFLFILLLWLPHMVVFYPGGLIYDTMDQLNQYAGATVMTNKHPVLTTLLMGKCIEIGRLAADDNLGVFLWSFAQMLSGAGVFSYAICLLKQWKVPWGIRMAVLLWYGLHPLFPGYYYGMLKDNIHAVFLILAILLFYEYLFYEYTGRGDFLLKRHKTAVWMGAMLGACLTRKNGIYIIAGMLVFLLIRKGRQKRVLGVFLIPIFLYLVIEGSVVAAMRIHQGSIAEVMSIPFQQTARYTKYYAEEMSEEEIEVIDSVLEYDRLGDRYRPYISDPVKGTYKESATLRDWASYLRVWFLQFCRHPKIYLDATIDNTYGYYYPMANPMGEKGFYTLLDVKAFPEMLVHETLFDFYTENPRFEKIKEAAALWINRGSVDRVLLLSLSYAPGAYTWLLCFVLLLLIRKERDSWVSIAPALMLLLICIASPVNAYVRYYFPIMATAPVFVCLLFRQGGQISNSPEGTDIRKGKSNDSRICP